MNPESAQTFGYDLSMGSTMIDDAFWIITGISLVLLFFIVASMLLFLIRYRRSRRNRVKNIADHLPFEALLIGGSLAIVIYMFFIGWDSFAKPRGEEKPSCRDVSCVDANAYMYGWRFLYRGPDRELLRKGQDTPFLVVPNGRQILLELDSVKIDGTSISEPSPVLHSLWIPAFRVKEDIVPRGGSQNGNWTTFRPSLKDEDLSSGEGRNIFVIECAEYCGIGHSNMNTTVCVIDPAEYDTWIKGDDLIPPSCIVGEMPDIVDMGESSFLRRCSGCHLDSGAGAAPSLVGVFGRNGTFVSGKTYNADEAYIRSSILQAGDEVVAGYSPMASFALSSAEIDNLVAYLKVKER